MTNNLLAFCSHPSFAEHETSRHHPERPDRIRAIHRAVRQAGLIDSPDPFPDFEIDLAMPGQDAIKPQELTPQPADPKWLSLVHTPAHIEKVRHVCAIGGGILD